ncbi:hypothetical protein PGB90_005713 [Kerria lacca]
MIKLNHFFDSYWENENINLLNDWIPANEEVSNFYKQLISKNILPRSIIQQSAEVEQLRRNSQIDDVVSVIYRQLISDGVLPKNIRKSYIQASEFRNQGNNEFARKNYIDALKYYTKYIAFSPDKSEEIAFAYGNRSAALFQLKKYTLCLIDINRALQQNCPESVKKKLLERKIKCKENIRIEEDMTIKFKNYLWQKNIQNLEKFMPFFETDSCATEINFDNKFPLPDVNFKNESIPNVSEKIEINFTKKMGKHILAKESIEPGELIGIQKAYVTHLEPKYSFTHCSCCFIRTVSLIPCRNCTHAMYCSERCREESYNLYHRIECETLQLMTSAEVSKYTYIVLRTVLIASKQGKELETLRTHPIYGKPFILPDYIANKKYDSNDYYNIQALIDHHEKHPLSLHAHYIQQAVILLHALKNSSFFDNIEMNKNSVKLFEAESFIGTLILKLLFAFKIYSFGIKEEIEDNMLNGFSTVTASRIGHALVPLFSLINHSCDPNVKWYWCKNVMVLYAIRPIAAGEQIYISYLPEYAHVPLVERQIMLKKFFFKCACNACKNNWPLYQNLPSKNTEYLLNKSDKKKFHKYITTRNNNIDSANEKLKFLCKYLSILHKNIERPFKEYWDCQALIEEIISMRGNKYNSNTDLIITFSD